MKLNPYIHFEIRFTPILNFPNSIYTEISPFLKLASGVSIENEQSTRDAKVALYFDVDHTGIEIRWDRIIFRCTTDRKDWQDKNNSIVTTFLNLFDKIKSTTNFNQINNTLFFGIFVNLILDDKKDSLFPIKDDFVDKYLSDTGKNVSNEYTDVGIVYENKNSQVQDEIKIGPYFGIEELEKHKIVIKNEELLKNLSNPGQIITYKKVTKTGNVDFNSFKTIFLEFLNITDKQWKE